MRRATIVVYVNSGTEVPRYRKNKQRDSDFRNVHLSETLTKIVVYG